MKEKHLSDEQLMSMATAELIELTKRYRDGDDKAFENAKYPKILKKRGLEFGVSQNFIHRIFQGEFDNADALEVSVKVKGN